MLGLGTLSSVARGVLHRQFGSLLWSLQTVRGIIGHRCLSSPPKKPSPPPGGSMIPRVNIGIFGEMNAGKSTFMNRITSQETSIVDAHPGTTADVKVALMELHNIGPVKLFDTAGLDELGVLGEKKKKKTLNVVKESDIVFLVVDPLASLSITNDKKSFDVHKEVLSLAQRREKDVFLVFNEFSRKKTEYEREHGSGSYGELLKSICSSVGVPGDFLALDLTKAEATNAIVEFTEKHYEHHLNRVPLLPSSCLGKDKTVFMNVPMDAETPSGRLLRPQAMTQEFCLRNFTTTLAYRMDLQAGRNKDDDGVREAERVRFVDAVTKVKPSLIVTDSQAMDLCAPWTTDVNMRDVELTTFSIMMINHMAGGNLKVFVDGLKALKSIDKKKKILIAEACNHNRITDICEDIGTVQIPNKLKKLFGEDVKLEHAFGREFPELKLDEYQLVIHCGGCMIDSQKMMARMQDCLEAGIPITNYGLLLSYFQSPQALAKVLRPWGLSID
uniref:HydF n=1 Tax=Stygiella incarcerata TaxID=1712417 RepID=A0A192ZIV3_9EUKA|nr:HydF [Stygiella incarcerata]ANM86879.1 HydF [Stygiella incarcerata]